MNAISALLKRYGMNVVMFWPAHANWRGRAVFDEAISKANLVLVNGEGTIHHDRPAGRRLLEIGAKARSERVPVALINTGWQENSRELTALLNDFDLVAARDTWSARRMRELGATVRIVPDLSLWFAQAEGFGPEQRHYRAGVGVTDNVNRFKSLKLEQLRSSIDARTLSIVYGTSGAIGWARFLRQGIALSKDLYHPLRFVKLLRLRHRIWRQCHADLGGLLAELATLELVVSGRFHVCTLALSVGTPLVAHTSNTDKIAALFYDAGLDSWRVEEALKMDYVQDARSLGWSEREFSNLRSYLDGAVGGAERLFSDLAELAANR